MLGFSTQLIYNLANLPQGNQEAVANGCHPPASTQAPASKHYKESYKERVACVGLQDEAFYIFRGQGASRYQEVRHRWVMLSQQCPTEPHGMGHSTQGGGGPSCLHLAQLWDQILAGPYKKCSYVKFVSSENKASGRKCATEETGNRSRHRGADSHLADDRTKGPRCFPGEKAGLTFALRMCRKHLDMVFEGRIFRSMPQPEEKKTECCSSKD